jgi:1-aminocyclopropane-1-carboxylate deaminase/D-cysteine desulfhydrase-like pyridoxal-dependent ACC family enzyme
MKRDDLTGLAGGGNKARKLEYLVGDALARGCDTLLTGGAAQSNHVRMTAAAACGVGLDCVAVLGGAPPDLPDGNLLLDHLFGAQLVWAGAYDAEMLETMMTETCMRLTDEGRRPYEVPLGGASDVGTLGYVVAAGEIASEAPIGSVVYTATGTGGTQAGLVVGFGHHARVRGVDVGAIDDVDDRIAALVAATASLARQPLPEGHLHLDRSQIGGGYGRPTDEGREALELCARLEGIVLDPVYSGKAMAALVADRRSGALAAHQPTVFVHTGGLPSLFADRYRSWLAG